MFGKITKLKMSRKLLLLATTVCVLVLAGILIYSNSRYSNRYLEKVKEEIHDKLYTEFVLNAEYYPWEEEYDGDSFGVNVNYEDRVVEVVLEARNKHNDVTREWLEKEYGKTVRISEVYFHDLIPDV